MFKDRFLVSDRLKQLVEFCRISRVAPDNSTEFLQVKEVRENNRTYLELGPLTDPVQAMILSEKIQDRFSVSVEIVTR